MCDASGIMLFLLSSIGNHLRHLFQHVPLLNRFAGAEHGGGSVTVVDGEGEGGCYEFEDSCGQEGSVVGGEIGRGNAVRAELHRADGGEDAAEDGDAEGGSELSLGAVERGGPTGRGAGNGGVGGG